MSDVFVVGPDEFNMRMLRTIRDAERLRFHPLLSFREAVRAERFRLEHWLDRAREDFERAGGRVDAIVGYWDFPTSLMRPLLRDLAGLPGPSLEAILRCEHKAWARMEQKACVPENTPGFCVFDPMADDPWRQIELKPPFWIKPLKSHSSYLGFRIEERADLEAALPRIRAGIDRFARPLAWILERAELPAEIRELSSRAFVAEEIISHGHQCTLEGYTWQGRPRVYGVVDSIREGRHRSCFGRYQYPSALPQRVQERMAEVACRFIAHAGLDRSDWNAEFYWNEADDSLYLLEVNTRCSQSHAPLFWLVDGRAHFEVMVDLALGREPRMPHREGRHATAAKFMVRVYQPDGRVGRVPDASDLRRVSEMAPDTLAKVAVEPGMRLSEMQHQDSYSYEIATLFMGARDTEELEAHYARAIDLLDFEIDPLDGGEEDRERPCRSGATSPTK